MRYILASEGQRADDSILKDFQDEDVNIEGEDLGPQMKKILELQAQLHHLKNENLVSR